MTGGLPSSLVGNPSMTVLIAAKSETSGGRILPIWVPNWYSRPIIGLGESGSFEYNNGTCRPSPTTTSSVHIGAAEEKAIQLK